MGGNQPHHGGGNTNENIQRGSRESDENTETKVAKTFNPGSVTPTAQSDINSGTLVTIPRTPGPKANTWVMSPTPSSMLGRGWIQTAVQCPACHSSASDPFICAMCGTFGHPDCLGAEILLGFPTCGACVSAALTEYAARENAIQREEWRKQKETQLEFLKSQTIKVLGISSVMGETLGSATAAAVGGAINLAKGFTAGVVQGVQIEGRKVRTLKDRDVGDILAGKAKMTAKEYAAVGHCLACHTANSNHYVHLRHGDCLKPHKPADLIPIPDHDDQDLRVQEPHSPKELDDSFQSVKYNSTEAWEQSNGIWTNQSKSVRAKKIQDVDSEDLPPPGSAQHQNLPKPEAYLPPASDVVTEAYLPPGYSPHQHVSAVGVQTHVSGAVFEHSVISGIFEKLEHIQKELADQKDASNKKIQLLSERVVDLENALEEYAGWRENGENV